GTPPSRILCLTYTKAAAAVMQSRIFRTLSSWNEFDDTQLQKILSQLENKPINAQKLSYARQLFARALETPGGLKIQTIHAFCESLLHQFMLEANIAGHFELIDDINRKKLLQEARRQLLMHNDIQHAL
ncbi:UvrD-helicase domain-containing protein, partial [Bartonella taylorii]